ncbi:MAG: YncE family protein [Acidimicrobiales bacterium]
MSQNARRIALLVAVIVVVGVAVFELVGGGGKAKTSTESGSTVNSTSGESGSSPPSSGTTAAPSSAVGMPPVLDEHNIYSEQAVGHLDPRVAGDRPLVYVPNGLSNTVTMIDPTTKQVVGSFAAGNEPQHIVPSYDLRTLWELNNQGNSLIPINPVDGSHGDPVAVDDPYNLYFTPDGKQAIVVAEGRKRLDFRDPKTMELQSSLSVTECDGINHSDYSADGGYAIFTCEFAGKLVKIDMATRSIVGFLDLGSKTMPQDIRAKADGKTFYVADMMSGGVEIVDGESFTKTGFIETGIGAHGLNPSRDGKTMYVANRGTDMIGGPPGGKGSVSVIDMATDAVTVTWPVPNGGSPDMGNITADGKELWLSGRYDSEVYVFDLVNGGFLTRIAVGGGPHGLTVWPQPGRFSLGHTGNMR